LALKAESDQIFNDRDVMDAIWDMVYRLFGEFGASQTALSLVKYDEGGRVVVVRCSHKALGIVRAAIAAVTEINGRCAVIRVVAVSGTLKALQKKLIG